MFSRMFRAVPLVSSHIQRRCLTTLIASNTTKNTTKFGLYLGAAILGTALGFGVNTAKSEESPSTWATAKEMIMTRYEGKIRDLSSPEKVFSVFASVHKDGKSYMTADDFIRALVPHQYHYETKAERKKAKQLPAAFKIADQNGDGLISFQEYLFFVTLLSIPEESFQVAFKLMDENGNGNVDQKEFLSVMSLVKKMSPASLTTSEGGGVAEGWLKHFFGVDGKKELSYTTFTDFLKQLNQDVLRMEFDLYDRENRGFLSQREFGLLLASFAGSKVFDRAVELNTNAMKPFSFEQFLAFNQLIEHIGDVEVAMQLYKLNNRPFRKQDLQRLTRIVCKTELNQQVVDTIMSIFDKNRDGTLEISEFVDVIQKRKIKGLSSERDTGFVRKFSRVWNCITDSEN